LMSVNASNGSTLPFPVTSDLMEGFVGRKLLFQYHELGLADTGVLIGAGKATEGLGPTNCGTTVGVGLFG
jgi:hypothetical protein